MGDISMRGKGRALKMKEGGRAAKRDLKAIGPTLKGRRKKRTDGAMKRRAEEASMKELRYPTSKPKRRLPDPERGPVKPMPMPMPRPERPNMKPMPYRKPRLPKDIEKYLMDMPRRVTPAMKKDGGSAKKPDSARGKSTRIGKIKKVVENIKKRGDMVGMPSMDPGKFKAVFGTGSKIKKLPPATQTLRRKQGTRSLQSLMAGSALKGAGKMGAGMAGQAMKLAKKLKPTGRINADDLKRAKETLMKKKGK